MRTSIIFLIAMIISFLHLNVNNGFSQESIVKDEFDLSINFTGGETGDSLLTFQIVNNSSTSLKIFPPNVESSKIVYVFPDQEELESFIIHCETSEPSYSILGQNEIKTYSMPMTNIRAILKLYQTKFGSNATYQIYWKVHDGNYVKETIYGKKGRTRVDRKPTYLRSNTVSITL